MTSEILLGYDDSDGCNLRGFYNPSVNKTIPCKTISVSEAERLQIMKNKLVWRVDNGKLVQIKDGNFKKSRSKRENLHQVDFSGKTYTVNSKLMSRVSLNLGICSLEGDHKCELWCIVDGAWQSVSHGKSELLGLAKELNLAIERQSVKLYGVSQ